MTEILLQGRVMPGRVGRHRTRSEGRAATIRCVRPASIQIATQIKTALCKLPATRRRHANLLHLRSHAPGRPQCCRTSQT